MSKISTVHIGRHEIGRFRFLLLSLMMMIGVRPLLNEWIGERIWADVSTDIFFGCALMSGLHAISGQPRQLRFSLLLVSSIIILSALHYPLPIPALDKVKLVLGAIFLVQMLIMIWTHIEMENEVTIDLIMAAACAYILLGMIWAYAYYFLESFHPDSFSTVENFADDLVDFNYYSFVTLTTVGYGDVLAITRAARALSIFEAITGQLYLAIMISRLVGLHASQSGNNKEK
ncbi:MAG: potassium channel family protein [Methylococcaceae bacterium]